MRDPAREAALFEHCRVFNNCFPCATVGKSTKAVYVVTETRTIGGVVPMPCCPPCMKNQRTKGHCVARLINGV